MARKAVKLGFKGFTLSELLIALAILGVIATFTIPKVLQSQQDGKHKAIVKEAVAMVAGAYEAYKLKNTASSATLPTDLTPYMNYVKFDTTSTIDEYQGDAGVTRPCDATEPCIKLHNGGMLLFDDLSFGGTATTNAIWFLIDPDGKVTDGTTNGPGKSLKFALYYNGRLATRSTILAGTTSGGGATYSPVAGSDPPWFSWN